MEPRSPRSTPSATRRGARSSRTHVVRPRRSRPRHRHGDRCASSSPSGTSVSRVVHGVEPIARSRPQGAGDLRSRRHRRGCADGRKAWSAGFAVVSLVAVLEHLVDPGAALRDDRRLLDAGRRPVSPGPRCDSVRVITSTRRTRNSAWSTSTTSRPRRCGTCSPSVGHGGRGRAGHRSVRLSRGRGRSGRRGVVSPKRPTVRVRDRLGWRRSDLHRYIARSAAKEAGVAATIAELADDQTPHLRLGHRDECPASAAVVEARRMQHRRLPRLEPALRRATARRAAGDAAARRRRA